VVFGRRLGQRVKSDKLAPTVFALVAAGKSYRQIGRQLDLSKNTVLEIVKRERVNADHD
jgi:putative DNA-invertase from lambdoid prophage Rac